MRQTGRTQNHTGTQQSADTPAPDTLRVPGPRPAGVVRSRPRRAAAEGRRSVRHLDNDGGLHREVIRLTQEAAEQVWASVREAKRLLARARRSRARAVGVSKRARARVLWQLSELIPLAERVVEQVRQRFAGEKISDRLVSLFDPDVRSIRRGKLATPTSSATWSN